MERYSLERALEEKDKIIDLTGDKATVEEYNEANEVVDSELLDYYRRFDKRFFDFFEFNISQAEKKRRLDESAKKYDIILDSDVLQKALAGEIKIDDLPKDLFDNLKGLAGKERQFSGPIRKDPELRNYEKLFQEAGIELPDDCLEYLDRHVSRHLFRLMLPAVYKEQSFSNAGVKPEEAENNICRKFGEDYLKYLALMKDPNHKDAREVGAVIAEEGNGVATFWTLAPYIHDELKRHGFSSEESMSRIFDLIRKSFNKYQKLGYFEIGDIAFKDASRIGNRHIFTNDYVLGLDERMPTHLLSRLYARNIIEHMNISGESTES